MADSLSKVPIIVVGTQADEYTNIVRGETFDEIRKEFSHDRARYAEELEKWDEKVEQRVRQRQMDIEEDIRKIPRAEFEGPVFVSKGMYLQQFKYF